MNAKKLYPLFFTLFLASLLVACQSKASTAEPDTQGKPDVQVETVIETVVVTKEVEGETVQLVITGTPAPVAPERVTTPTPAPTYAPEAEGYAAPAESAPDRVSDYEPVTAGVVDDNEGWDDYREYISHSHVNAHRRDVSERYRIQVQDHAGQPVHDASVYVYVGDQLFFQGRTDAGGQLYFHPRAIDAGQQAGQFRVLAYKG
ncbi:MAG: hypothetical protein GY792_00560, partial [Gammaproteobacteria bacterium]|nr:hypothetical protein [Gammaproteobacteria bacterium]